MTQATPSSSANPGQPGSSTSNSSEWVVVDNGTEPSQAESVKDAEQGAAEIDEGEFALCRRVPFADTKLMPCPHMRPP